MSLHCGLYARGRIRIWFAAHECLISGAVDESLVHIWLREHGGERLIRHAINMMKKLGGWTFILLARKQDLIPLLLYELLLIKWNAAFLKRVITRTNVGLASVLDLLLLLIQKSLITRFLVHFEHGGLARLSLCVLRLVLQWLLEHLFFFHLINEHVKIVVIVGESHQLLDIVLS